MINRTLFPLLPLYVTQIFRKAESSPFEKEFVPISQHQTSQRQDQELVGAVITNYEQMNIAM